MKRIICILTLTAALFAATGNIVWRDLVLRKGPGTHYSKIKTFHKGKYFKILAYEGKWVKVNSNDYIGYFNRAGIKPVEIMGKYTIRDPQGVTFKWGPGQRYPDLAQGNQNIVVEVVWEAGNYYFGQYNGSGVYFHKEALDGPKTDYEIKQIVDQRNQSEAVYQPIPMPLPDPVPVPIKPKRRFIPLIGLHYANGGIDATATEEDVEGFQQITWALGGYAGTRISFGQERNFGMTLRLKGSWTPKEFITPIRGTDYQATEQYIFASFNLGMEFDLGNYLTFGLGGGIGSIYDIIEYGLADGEQYSLSEELYLGPTGFAELAGGLRHLRVVAGADYNFWVSDKSRFYVLPASGSSAGEAVSDGNEYNRHMIRAYAGIQVLF